MTVYVDTSALYALLSRTDMNHGGARTTFTRLLDVREPLVTSSYVVVEVATLTQRRLGVAAARAVHERLVPMLRVVWVDRDLHDQAFSALLAANRRRISLVDWTSFTLMRRHGLSTALAYDDDFTDQGFELLPP